jgi:hypothetical protein
LISLFNRRVFQPPQDQEGVWDGVVHKKINTQNFYKFYIKFFIKNFFIDFQQVNKNYKKYLLKYLHMSKIIINFAS